MILLLGCLVQVGNGIELEAPVAPLWCDLGFVPNSRGNKAAANLRPMGKVVASNVGRWKVALQQCSDPSFLMFLVLHVLDESLFSLVVVT